MARILPLRRLPASLLTALGSFLVASLALAQPTAESQPAPAPTLQLPEAPETVIEGRLDGVGSQGTAVSGRTELTTPNLTPTALAETGSSISVVTEEQIRQRGGQANVAEILRGLPGVDVVRQSTPGSTTSIFLRGAGGEHTKVLIDGIPVNDPINTTRFYDFSNLSTDNIERIEVLRGPQSVLYGSDAIGGVINIVTKKGSGTNTGRIAASGGSFSTSNTAFNTSGSRGAVYYSAGGSYFDSNGFSAASDRLPGNTEDDGFKLGTFSSRIGWQPNENVDVDWVVRHSHSHVAIDAGGGANRDDPNSVNTALQTVSGLRVHTRGPGGIYEHMTAYYVSDVQRGINNPFDPNNPFAFTGKFDGVTQQIDSRHTLHLVDGDRLGNSVTFGGLYQTEVGSSSTSFDFGGFLFPSTFPKTSLDDAAVYGQNQLRIGDDWFTTVGVRSDHYNQFGANDTYRVTSLYRLPGSNTTFRGSLGTGFRAPSIFQRFDPTVGNAGLRPEDSKGWDCGLEQPLFGGDVVPSVTYFRNEFSDFIFFDQNANFGLGQYLNIPSVRTSGVEFNTLFVVSRVATITTSYTYLDALDLSPTSPDFGRQLLRRPRNKWSLNLNRRVFNDRGNWYLGFIFVGDRDDAVGFPSTRIKLDSYLLVNTALTLDVSRRLQVFGRIDNLFNADYEEVSGFGVAPASAYAGAALRW